MRRNPSPPPLLQRDALAALRGDQHQSLRHFMGDNSTAEAATAAAAATASAAGAPSASNNSNNNNSSSNSSNTRNGSNASLFDAAVDKTSIVRLMQALLDALQEDELDEGPRQPHALRRRVAERRRQQQQRQQQQRQGQHVAQHQAQQHPLRDGNGNDLSSRGPSDDSPAGYDVDVDGNGVYVASAVLDIEEAEEDVHDDNDDDDDDDDDDGNEADSALVENLLPLLELSGNDNYAQYLCDVGLPFLVQSLLLKASKVRTVEVAMGVLANLARFPDGVASLIHSENLLDWCWTFIVAASDPAALHEVIRLVECFVASEDFAAQCLAGLKSSGAAEQLIFIVSNTLSGQLCERAARLMAHLIHNYPSVYTRESLRELLPQAHELLRATWLSTSGLCAVVELIDYVGGVVPLSELDEICPTLGDNLVDFVAEQRFDLASMPSEVTVIAYLLTDLLDSNATLCERIVTDHTLMRWFLDIVVDGSNTHGNGTDSKAVVHAVMLLLQVVLKMSSTETLQKHAVRILVDVAPRFSHDRLPMLPWDAATREKILQVLKVDKSHVQAVQHYEALFQQFAVTTAA